jgi:hypothetical protein
VHEREDDADLLPVALREGLEGATELDAEALDELVPVGRVPESADALDPARKAASPVVGS